MSSEKLKVGVVGLGAFVEIAHFPCYFNSPYAELIKVEALCDCNEERLRALSDKFGVSLRFTDYRQMLEKTELCLLYTSPSPRD